MRHSLTNAHPEPHAQAPARGRARAAHPGPPVWPWLQWLKPQQLGRGLVTWGGLRKGGLVLSGLVLSALAPSNQVLAAPAAASTLQLPDPTRPPVALQMATAAQDIAQRLTPADPAEPAAPAPLPVLQGVQIGAHGSASALLDGQLLTVGDKLGDLKVVAIDRQGVTLRGGQGEQRLTLLSGEAKQPAGSINLTRNAGLVPAGRRATPAKQAPAPPADAPGDTPRSPPTKAQTDRPGDRSANQPATPSPEPQPAVRKTMQPAGPAAVLPQPTELRPTTAAMARADPARPAPPLANEAATAVLVADQTRP